jgi:hypothetical protein
MAWRNVLDLAHDTSRISISHSRSHSYGFVQMELAVIRVLNNFKANPASLRKLGLIFDGPEEDVRNCKECREHINQWRYGVQKAVNEIPPFSYFLQLSV